MRLYILNGLIDRRGGPRESVEVVAGMVVRIRIEGGEIVEGPVEKVWKKTIRVKGKNYALGDMSISQMIVLATPSRLPCYDSYNDEPRTNI